MPESPTVWDRTKQYSNTAYTKALKPGFDKAYKVVNKLEPHVNRLSYKVGSESFWPGSLDKESEKAARILRSFCKDGFYDRIDEAAAKKAEAEGITLQESPDSPKGKQRVIMKIPAKVIRNAKGLAIFTCMRTGWVIGGSGGAGILIGRHPETGEWSPPSGIHMQNLSVGFLIGVDFTDTVLVINTYEALKAFTKLRCTLGTEIAVAAGPVGIGGTIDTEVTKIPAPVWSYVKSRGVYGGVAVDGNVVIERTDENERFYNERVGVAKILLGEVRYPPVDKYKVLIDTIRAAQGDEIDENLLPDGVPPSDMEIGSPGSIFGIPDEDDPDPFGVKALEAQGLSIREAGTHRRASPETFEFKPSPTSPIYNTYRRSIDAYSKRTEWRNSTASVASTTSINRGTQTDEDEVKIPRVTDSPLREVDVHHNSPLRGSISAASTDKLGGLVTSEKSVHHTGITDGMGLGIDTGASLEKDKLSLTLDEDATLETPTATKTLNTPINSPDTKQSTEIMANDGSSKQDPDISIDGPNKDDHREDQKHNKDDEEDDADDESDGEYSDFEEVEIVTAVPVTAKPKAGMVNIPQRIPPALPPRNPIRMSRTSTEERLPHDSSTEALSNGDNLKASQDSDDVDVTAERRGSDNANEVHLRPGMLRGDEEFHSAAPSPVEEKKQHEPIVATS